MKKLYICLKIYLTKKKEYDKKIYISLFDRNL